MRKWLLAEDEDASQDFSASRGANLLLRLSRICIFILILCLQQSLEITMQNLHRECVKQSNEMHQMRYFWNWFFSGNFSVRLNMSHCFLTLVNEYQSWTQKQGSVGVVSALQLCYVTGSRCFCSWSLSEYFTLRFSPGRSLRRKGNHNKFCSATSPYFPPPSCSSSSFSIHCISFSIPASLFSPTQFLCFFFSFFHLWLSVPQFPTCYHLLPSSRSER